MTIARKTAVLLATTIVLMAVAIYAISQVVLLGGFSRVEEASAREDVGRVQKALASDIAALTRLAEDWSNWNDSYAFVEDANQDFIDANLHGASFAKINADVILCIDVNGSLVNGTAFNRHTGQSMAVPSGFVDHFLAGSPLLRDDGKRDAVSGVLNLTDQQVVFAALPILNSEYKGPAHGTLVFARLIDTAMIDTLSTTVDLPVAFAKASSESLTAAEIAVLAEIQAGSDAVVFLLSEEEVNGYGLVKDIYGEPALLFQIRSARDIHAQGLQTIRYFLTSIGLIGLIVMAVTLVSLQRIVLGRLRRLAVQVRGIGESGNLQDRVSEEGKDELASLGRALNRTLESLDQARKQRQKAEEQLVHDAFHDALTGLPNRALCLDRIALEIERPKRRSGYTFAVLFADLDGFKGVNDRFGHSAGDALLVDVATRIRESVRAVDTVARIGGDEFVVILVDLDSAQDALDVAERVRIRMSRPFPLVDQQVHCTASIGIVVNDGSSAYERADEVLRDADFAMYRAKALGRARCELFETKLRWDTLARLQLESELRGAVDNQQFVIHYQPVFRLASREIAGLEALVRWEHPRLGLLQPSEFISVAEETGALLKVDEFVLREACRQMGIWRSAYCCAPPLFVSVN